MRSDIDPNQWFQDGDLTCYPIEILLFHSLRVEHQILDFRVIVSFIKIETQLNINLLRADIGKKIE